MLGKLASLLTSSSKKGKTSCKSEVTNRSGDESGTPSSPNSNNSDTDKASQATVAPSSVPESKSPLMYSSDVAAAIKFLVKPALVQKLRGLHHEHRDNATSSEAATTKVAATATTDSTPTPEESALLIQLPDLSTPAMKLSAERRQDVFVELYLQVCRALCILHERAQECSEDPSLAPIFRDAHLETAARRIIGYLYASAGEEAKDIRDQAIKGAIRRDMVNKLLSQTKEATWEYFKDDEYHALPEKANKVVEESFCEFLRTEKPATAKYSFPMPPSKWAYDYTLTFDEIRPKDGFKHMSNYGYQNVLRRMVRGQDSVAQALAEKAQQEEAEAKKASTCSDSEKDVAQCQICYSPFDDCVSTASPESKGADEDPCRRVHVLTCGHNIACQDCFSSYVLGKLERDEVLPYVRCPHPDCKMPITADSFYEACLPVPIYLAIAKVHLQKTISRNPDWIQCSNEGCVYGFLFKEPAGTAKTLRCALCHKQQEVKKADPNQDEDFQRMLKEGTIRLCPACKYPAIKEFGMCNIMNCGQCGIFWNWRTYQTAPDSHTLKMKARAEGTLWEPGNLEYQMRLQRENLPEFIALLKRNGIEYDPNYRRGGW